MSASAERSTGEEPRAAGESVAGRETVAARRILPAALVVASLLLAALNLRTAVTSVGPVLDEMQRGIGLSGALAGLLTTLPVLSFAALGSLTPMVADRLGHQRTLALAMLVMTIGLATRALAGSAWLFLLLSVAALAGGAMGNVLLPVLVKVYFPRQIGPMTAAYTTALAVGTTIAAALTAPLAHLRDPMDWRVGVGSWAVLAGVGTVACVALPKRSVLTRGRRPADRRPIHRSRLAWAMAIFFGAQSTQAYVQFGWFALYFQERAGVSATRAGLLVAVLAGLSIPISMLVPSIASRLSDHRGLIAGLIGCTVIAYIGMLTAPRAGAWVWVVVAGIGGGSFPLVLTLIGLRTRGVAVTAALSAFAQSLGYLLSGAGPLLVGVLHEATDGWTWPFVVLFIALGAMAASGWVIGRPRYIEDDLQRLPGKAVG